MRGTPLPPPPSVPEPQPKYRTYPDGGASLRKLVPHRIKEICREYFDWELEGFHLEALQLMFQGGYLVVNWPTDHAKSTMGCFLFPLLSLMADPNETHIICGANINDSKRRIQALEREIETNTKLVRDYPWIAKPENKDVRIWSSTQFNVVGRTINKPNPSVLASAVGSNDIKGRRGKLIMDDIEGEDARWSPVKREQLYSWLKLEAWRCFEDKRETLRPLLCLMGTPFDVDSIYFRAEHQGWQVTRKSCYLSEWTTNALGDPLYQPTYLWPAKEEKVARARKTLRRLEFSVAYLMDPTGGDPNRLSAKEIERALQESEFDASQYITLASIDPASGSTTKQADYAGITVVRVHWPQAAPLPDVEILEAHPFSGGLFEQVHLLASLAKSYDCPVIYEGNSQQEGTYRDTFQHLYPHIRLIRHYTSHSNKMDSGMGLTVVRTLATNRKLRVQPELLETEGIRSLIQEIRDLQPPFRQHNHISAAVWFAVRYCYEKVRHLDVKVHNGYAVTGNPGHFFAGRDLWRRFGYESSERQAVMTKAQQEEVERFQRQLGQRQ